jgi:hypothetical protein
MTTRRGIIGMLAAGPVVAPELGKSLADSMSMTEKSYSVSAPSSGLAGAMHDKLYAEPEDFEKTYIGKRVKALFSPDAESKLLAEMNSTHPVLDIDLHVNRSMSLPMKYMLQRQRNIKASIHNRRRMILREAREYMPSGTSTWLPNWVYERMKEYGVASSWQDDDTF